MSRPFLTEAGLPFNATRMCTPALSTIEQYACRLTLASMRPRHLLIMKEMGTVSFDPKCDDLLVLTPVRYTVHHLRYFPR